MLSYGFDENHTPAPHVDWFGEGTELKAYVRSSESVWYTACNRCRANGSPCARCQGSGIEPNAYALTTRESVQRHAEARQRARHTRTVKRADLRAADMRKLEFKRDQFRERFPAAAMVASQFNQMILEANHSESRAVRDRRARLVTPAVHAVVVALYWPSGVDTPVTNEMVVAMMDDYARPRTLTSFAPVGRVRIEGTVTGFNRSDTAAFGIRWTMTVLDRRGFRVHGTIPRALLPGRVWNAEERTYDAAGVFKGAKVAFDASVDPQEHDPGFGYYHHATKAVMIDGEF